MPSPRKKKPVALGDSLLFKRTTRTPRSVESAADLWLGFFCQGIDILLSESISKNPVEVTRDARLLADAALSTYQDRWPGVEPSQQ